MNPIHARLQDDFEFFAEHAPLLIKDVVGALVPFKLNIGQRFLLAAIKEQLQTVGYVRICVLKGRQQGISTFINGYYYHRTTRIPGTSTFILSHEGKTTDKLFKMVDTYHEHVHPTLRPVVGASNRNQLSFPGIRSDYAVGTAGNEQVGRGGTAQLFHGSEVAYWEHAYAIQDGALESIALAAGTHILLESTANGPVGLFYEKCMQALKGVGTYRLVFIPWFWEDRYEMSPLAEGELDDDERLILATYLSKPFPFEQHPPTRDRALRKLAWRRAKVVDFSTGNNIETGKAKFKTIYPCNPVEAFQASGVGLIRPDAILAARTSKVLDDSAPLILGVDPAGDSDVSDRTVIVLRQGREWTETLKYPRMRPMELAGILAKLMETRKVEMCFVDRGYGEGTIDRLWEMGFRRQVQGVAFNERPMNPDVYLNKRSEMIIEAATWVNAGGVRIPDDDEVHADLACMPLDEETSNGLKFLKSKREVKKLLGRSPDILDALALTFAYPVRRDVAGGSIVRKAPARVGGTLRSLRGRAR